MKRLFVVAATIAILACGYHTLTAPDGGPVRLVSGLGFRVEATQEYLDNGGHVVQAHADLADRWWTSLMSDLRAAGYSASQANQSRNAQWVFVYLYKPIGADSSITCPGWSVLVGGCYDQFKPGFRVPGDYTDPDGWLGARPTAQPLKHEMTHHWCYRLLGHMCMTGSEHKWVMPNGVNVWDVQWYDGYPPAAAAAMSAATASERCPLTESY